MFTEDADVVLSSDVALETEFADMNITTVPMFRSITVAAKELNSIKQMVVSPKIEPLEEEDPCPPSDALGIDKAPQLSRHC